MVVARKKILRKRRNKRDFLRLISPNLNVSMAMEEKTHRAIRDRLCDIVDGVVLWERNLAMNT